MTTSTRPVSCSHGTGGSAFAAAQAHEADAPAPYGVRDALCAATVGGTLAAGLGDEIGILVVDASADLTVLSLD